MMLKRADNAFKCKYSFTINVNIDINILTKMIPVLDHRCQSCLAPHFHSLVAQPSLFRFYNKV